MVSLHTNLFVRNYLKFNFSHEGALAVLESTEPIELLFVDLTLQGNPEAGLSLASKAVELRPDLKVLYTSAQGATDGMIALFVKNSAFLPKPYTVDQLKAILLIKFEFRPNASNQNTSDFRTGH